MMKTRNMHEEETSSREISTQTAVDEIYVCKTRCLFYGWIIFLAEEEKHFSTFFNPADKKAFSEFSADVLLCLLLLQLLL